MRQQLAEILCKLQTANFIRFNLNQLQSNSPCDLEFSGNALLYTQALLQQWRSSDAAADLRMHFLEHQTLADVATAADQRLSFVRTAHFQQHLKHLRAHPKPHFPAVIKQQLHLSSSCGSLCFSPTAEIQLKILSTPSHTQLISDYFFDAQTGLEKFYNIQRERKICWMRSAANPSRFFLEPHKLSESESANNTGCQSINIKSQFEFGACNVEHITLLPLHQQSLQHPQHYYLESTEQSGIKVLPAIIRSVIDLEQAALVMLLDGYAHQREHTLLLNHKLAPYQCAVACLHKDIALSDLQDLQKHLHYVLREQNLRLYEQDALITNSEEELHKKLQFYDSMGIPYVLIIEEGTLRNGLLKLRNRDTTLEETIHISDLTDYLPKLY